MSKILKIGEKEYTLEFTIEASLYKECIEKTVSLVGGIAELQGESAIKKVVEQISDIPQTALTMFYAGLIENHGADGDETVEDEKTAKTLLKQYFKENPDAENANFYGMMEFLLECMSEDGFFKQIGLEQMISENQTEEQNEKPKAKK